MSVAETLVESPISAPAAGSIEAAPAKEGLGIGPWPWHQVVIGLGALVLWRVAMQAGREWMQDWPPLVHVALGAIVPQMWMIFWPLGTAKAAGDERPFRVPGLPAIAREVGLGLVGGFASIGLLYGLAMLYQWLTGQPLGTAVEAAANGSDEIMILACLAFTVAPFAEEIFFRGFLYTTLRPRLGIAWALIAQAAIFAALHDLAPLKLVVIFVLGLVLGCAYEVRKTLTTSITIHVTLNLIWSLTVFAMMLIFAHAPYLGVQGEPQEQGIAVTKVLPDSPAAEAGLQAGDVILSLGGEKAVTQDQIARLVRSQKAGDALAITVLREGKELSLEATLAKRPRAE